MNLLINQFSTWRRRKQVKYLFLGNVLLAYLSDLSENGKTKPFEYTNIKFHTSIKPALELAFKKEIIFLHRRRKEREAREQQDVMTLGETREQISQLEAKLQMFKEEKHQLFLQLKRVLNEDDHRRRQLQQRDANEQQQQMVQIQSLQQQGLVPHQPQTVYVQQPLPPGRIQTIQAPPQMPAAYKTAIKRPRSPSPPPQVPVSLYHQGYAAYKPQGVTGGSYQASPQKDDGRRNELVRAVLWNKAPQYSNQPSAFYPVAPQDISIYYPGLSREAVRPVYDQQRPQGFPIEHKLPEHYTTLRTATSQHGHVIHPGPGLTINPAQAQPKGGSITAGYPVRTQQYHQQAAPASLYTTQSRQMYQNYPQRE